MEGGLWSASSLGGHSFFSSEAASPAAIRPEDGGSSETLGGCLPSVADWTVDSLSEVLETSVGGEKATARRLVRDNDKTEQMEQSEGW